MTAFEFGDVVLVRFPFTDQSATKQRPAVVISSEAYHRARPDLVIMAITSQARPRPAIGEASILRWQEAGLIKPSVFKPLLATVERNLVRAQARPSGAGGPAGPARAATTRSWWLAFLSGPSGRNARRGAGVSGPATERRVGRGSLFWTA
jgi:mRNA interferase MazF